MPIVYDLLRKDEVDVAHGIELAGFPADEAASLEAFQYRQENAPDLFLAAYEIEGTTRSLVGYVCSTLSPASTLTHESMSNHVPNSSSVCIHSICVSPDHRRKGIALGLLTEYISRLTEAAQNGAPYERILLISHEELRELYEKAGFEFVGSSAVTHGSRPWFEMRKVLSAVVAANPAPPPTLPSNIFDLLRSSSTRSKPTGQLLSSYSHGTEDVSETDNGIIVNKTDLLCPREGCGSIIIKNGVAHLEEGASVQLEPPGRTPMILAPMPTSPEQTKWWKIPSANAMVFENIGVSDTVQLPDGRRRKFLTCADCDLGPLGWFEPGVSGYWLVPTRVRYRV